MQSVLRELFQKMIVIISTSVTLRQLSKYMCTNKCDKNKLTLRMGKYNTKWKVYLMKIGNNYHKDS